MARHWTHGANRHPFGPGIDGVGGRDPNTVAYPTVGGIPKALDVADTNQDGVADLAVAYDGTETFSLLNGYVEGILKAPSHRHWLEFIHRVFLGRTYTATELAAHTKTLIANELMYLTGPAGTLSPIGITAVDTKYRTYRLISDLRCWTAPIHCRLVRTHATST